MVISKSAFRLHLVLLATFVASGVLLIATVLPIVAVLGAPQWQSGSGTVDAIAAGLTTLAIFYGLALAVTSVIGIPLWLLLRSMGREGWFAYVCAGALAGTLAEPVVAAALGVPFAAWLIALWLWSGCAGVFTAMAFRTVVRHNPYERVDVSALASRR